MKRYRLYVNVEGSWKFLCAVDAEDQASAPDPALIAAGPDSFWCPHAAGTGAGRRMSATAHSSPHPEPHDPDPLPPQRPERKVRREAARLDVEPDEYVRRVVFPHLSMPASGDGSVSDLFARWCAEDVAADAVEVARREAEFEAFKEAMNRSRANTEGPAARKPYP